MILSIIGKIIDIISGLVFKLLKFFNLQLLFISALLWLILYLFGALEIGWVKTVMYVLIGVSVFYAIVLTVIAPFRRRKKEKGARGNKKSVFPKKGDSDKVEEKNSEEIVGNRRESSAENITSQKEQAAPAFIEEKDEPVFYTVRQNPEYVMAEYKNKVELYKKTPQGLVYIRTDEKRREE